MSNPIPEALNNLYDAKLRRIQALEAALKLIATCHRCKLCHDKAKAALEAK